MKKDILNNDMWRKNVDNDISEKVRLLMENIIDMESGENY